MTYNQVQSFQINYYVNHYEDIEITGYRAIYSKMLLLLLLFNRVHHTIMGK